MSDPDEVQIPVQPDPTTSPVEPDGPKVRLFTMHLDFLASDSQDAQWLAASYANALVQLCPEVEAHRARVSMNGDEYPARRVFCRALGPWGEIYCTQLTGHEGMHHVEGERWGNDEVPVEPGDVVVSDAATNCD